MAIYGIDVSEKQGNISWRAVKDDGVQFAMLRAGCGAGDIDVQFRNNAEGCTREKIPFGVYWHSYAYTSPMAYREAEFCIETVEDYRLSYPVCIVLDQDSVKYAKSKGVIITKILAEEIVEVFCGRVEQRGYPSMFCSNKEFLGQMFAAGSCQRHPLWYVQCEGALDLCNAAIWQYTRKGAVRGIKGPVNEDKSFRIP